MGIKVITECDRCESVGVELLWVHVGVNEAKLGADYRLLPTRDAVYQREGYYCQVCSQIVLEEARTAVINRRRTE